ncbi:hypothetical protein JBL43_16520 [Aureibaculum sp. A20]|uniref:Uncharacterized protein n=1 Tax=Aureibaculum flavum TaxID=2795986 RepID=A0ABS0WV41_9FLAO|nr:hypothetical protein [Aureibaculum flavum]MBJ2175860.1 hypothetical protein [Aureibaculum flavum]
MHKVLYIAYLLLICNSYTFSQVEENYSDELLSSSFKLYHEADMYLANYMYSFIKKRFIDHLKDTTSFSNPYDSLSKHVSIGRSSDGLMKTYSWSERDFGCCHGTETYAQFKTSSGSIKFIDLDEQPEGYEEVFITGLQLIKIKKKSYYLIFGNGTCCGGTHYSTARVYEIKEDTLHKSDSLFNTKSELYIGANRSQTIALTYDSEKKILSYNSYAYLDDTGFYANMKTVIQLKLTDNGFQKIE